jgi:hypothetical protein
MVRSSRRKVVQPTAVDFASVQRGCLTTITTDLEKIKADNGGKIPYGMLAKTVQEYQVHFPWVTKNMVQSNLQRLNKLNDTNKMVTTEISQNTMTRSGTISILTLSSALAEEITGEESVKSNIDETSTVNSTASFAQSASAEDSFDDSSSQQPTERVPGRPKGTTVENAMALKRQIELASEEAATKYSEARK